MRRALCLSLALFALGAAAAPAAKTRTEHDLLGDKAVPADAYYGVQTLRALENFQISGRTLRDTPDFVDALAIVKLAAARANHALGGLDAKKLDAIERACQAVLDGKYRDQFGVDWYQGGAGTSANMNANEVLAKTRRSSRASTRAATRSSLEALIPERSA
jgi:aspartate ammonia-lyase